MLANWKPAKGSYRASLLAQRAKIRAHERQEKEKARRRDGPHCRYPACDAVKRGFARHIAHLEDKGMGGDKQQLRTQAELLISLCVLHHEGTCSLHSGDIRIEPVFPEQGTNGPCTFWRLDEQKGWTVDGIN